MDASSFAIRDLTPDDAAAVDQAVDLLLTGFPDWTPTPEEAWQQLELSLAPDRVCLGAFAAGDRGSDLLGWVGAVPEYSHAWELHPLVVRADARGRGIGRALVTALEDRLRGRGVLTLYLGTDDEGATPGTSAGGVDLFPDPLAHALRLESFGHAVGFYRRVGFAVVGLIPDANGPGKPDVLMAKRIG